MTNPALQLHPKLVSQPAFEQETEARFQKALEYFRSRGSVVFVSYCRFWEKHAFVQQCLAKLLVDNGIPVTWLDGATWRRYTPTLYFQSPKLKVRSFLELPGRRYPGVQTLNDVIEAMDINGLTRAKSGKKPVLWIQGGLKDPVVFRIPEVDVLSTFDDCRYNPLGGTLFQKTKLILAQNEYAFREIRARYPQKTLHALPPIDMNVPAFDDGSEFALPAQFPREVVGYIGSFFPDDFDFLLFENLVRTIPTKGFLLLGRTRGEGERHLDRLRKYPNFCHLPWVPREKVGAVWKKLSLTLLLYRGDAMYDGAFPTKLVESLHYGVPAVATRVPKTLDLEGHCLRSSFPDRLRKAIQEGVALSTKTQEFFSQATHPKLHLARVAESLSANGSPKVG